MKNVKEAQVKRVDDCPAVMGLLEKKKNIAAQIGQIEAEIQIAQNAGNDVQRQAAAVLAGNEVGSAQRELDMLHHRRRVLREAMQQLDVQVQDARLNAAETLSKQYSPEYKELSARTLDSMKQLKDLLMQERAFYGRMRTAGLHELLKERLDVQKFIGGHGQENHPDHSLLHKHIQYRQGLGR